MRKLILIILLLSAILVSAHENLQKTEDLELAGYKTTFYKNSQINVGEAHDLVLEIKNFDNKSVDGLSVHGQIIDDSGAEIFYGTALEKEGKYYFNWKPSFAGNYYVQFIFRVPINGEEKSFKPVFEVPVVDPRAPVAFGIGAFFAVLSLIIGLVLSFKGKFVASPILWGVLLAAVAILLGYSVASYYTSGGDRGFVICGAESCDLAIHWHSQTNLKICGSTITLPFEKGELDSVHTHKEPNYLHFHSLVKSDESGQKILTPERLDIGLIFEKAGVRFNQECLGDYCNGDVCSGSDAPGKLTMTVNNQPNYEFNDYSYNDADEIRIEFS